MIVKSRVLVLIQARTSSSRLPGKVLRRIGGMPSVCVSAKRAANTGLKVIVVTSTDSSDDQLVRTLEEHSISVRRGSLDDVRQRFIQTLAEFPECEIVVRLTADNLLPDGHFIEMVISEYVSRGLPYLSTDMGLMPYGLSVEVFSKRQFLDIHKNQIGEADKEHVTTALRNETPRNLVSFSDCESRMRLRCTIDYSKDFDVMSALFETLEEPLTASCSSIVKTLESMKFSPQRISLGTVQLGMPYGVANSSGQPSEEEAEKILTRVYEAGVRYLDTAQAYGQSEELIGKLAKKNSFDFKLTTKLPPSLSTESEAHFLQSISEAFEKSLERLYPLVPQAILFHRANHLEVHRGTGVHYARELADKYGIQSVGVSITSPSELLLAVSDELISQIQLPYNILDHRWTDSLNLLREFNIRGRIQTRSCFLQGILLLSENRIPEWLPDRELFVEYLRQICPPEVARLQYLLSFVESVDWIDEVVIGAETDLQILEILKAQETANLLDAETLKRINLSRPKFSEALLNPADWNMK